MDSIELLYYGLDILSNKETNDLDTKDIILMRNTLNYFPNLIQDFLNTLSRKYIFFLEKMQLFIHRGSSYWPHTYRIEGGDSWAL